MTDFSTCKESSITNLNQEYRDPGIWTTSKTQDRFHVTCSWSKITTDFLGTSTPCTKNWLSPAHQGWTTRLCFHLSYLLNRPFMLPFFFFCFGGRMVLYVQFIFSKHKPYIWIAYVVIISNLRTKTDLEIKEKHNQDEKSIYERSFRSLFVVHSSKTNPQIETTKQNKE